MSTWLTPGRRQAIQAAGATIVTGLTTLGLITGGQAETITTLIAQVLAVLMAGLALAHLDRSQAATWMAANLRATLYGLALAVAGVGMAFNLIGQEDADRMLLILSVVLTVLQALVAVVNAPTDDPSDPAAVVPRHAATPTPVDDAPATAAAPESGGAEPRAPGGATAVPVVGSEARER